MSVIDVIFQQEFCFALVVTKVALKIAEVAIVGKLNVSLVGLFVSVGLVAKLALNLREWLAHVVPGFVILQDLAVDGLIVTIVTLKHFPLRTVDVSFQVVSKLLLLVFLKPFVTRIFGTFERLQLWIVNCSMFGHVDLAPCCVVTLLACKFLFGVSLFVTYEGRFSGQRLVTNVAGKHF